MTDSKNIVLVDTEKAHRRLLPLSFTRPIGLFRLGICTLKEKWEALLPGDYSYLTADYLSEKYPANICDDNYFIAAHAVANPALAEAVASLRPGEWIFDGEEMIAFRGARMEDTHAENCAATMKDVKKLRYHFDIFLLNPAEIVEDFRRITAGRESAPLPADCRWVGPRELPDGTPALFIEEGTMLTDATFNTSGGPIYIGRRGNVMEGSTVRGPMALCENAKIRMGAKIYGGSTFGPYAKAGGEIDNIVMFGYCNKAHDGYLGNAVIGEWCNIGAGTNSSNLKNDYSKVRVWDYESGRFLRTDLQFCGLIMGDHSRAGINCMFNTSTVTGVGVNVHGAGFPRTYLHCFTEGSATAGFTPVSMKHFLDMAERMMNRRNMSLTDADKRIFEAIAESGL